MARQSFELTTRMNGVQRSRGHSATARAAYRACCVIECEREGRTHDYRRKRGLDVAEITLPKGAPAWALDAGKLWNAAEQRERNRDSRAKSAWKANAQTARDFLFSFPAELSQEGRRTAAQIVAAHLVEISQVAVQHAIHAPGKEGDERNWHCHLMFTTRRMTESGLGEKTREWDERDRERPGPEGSNAPNLAKQLRAFVAATLNALLAAEGKAELVHVEHETFKARGHPQKATRHQGPAQTHIPRKVQAIERGAWIEQHRTEQRQRHGKELASLKVRQEFGLQTKLADLNRRGREGAQAIKRELDRQRRQDPKPEGLRRAFLTVTGRAGREAFDRQQREGQRLDAAREKLATLKAELRQERTAYAEGQTQDRAQLIDRHRAEDRQLQQAVTSRESLDQSAYRALQRQARSQEQDQQQKQTQTRSRTRGGPEFT